MHIRLVWLALVGLLPSLGCGSLMGPHWDHPGPANYQQKRAQRFDPYPEIETGPAVDGSRPRDYDRPLPETMRSRWFHW